MIDRNKLAIEFDQYVSAYDAEDPKIRLKIDHSYRVADLAERIALTVKGAAAETGVNAEPCADAEIDADFAWTMGLLHDIGRFEQVRRFGTFVDARSVDHAQFGADLLFQDPGNLLEKFGSDRLSGEQKRRMETAIRFHSAYRLPEGLSAQERICCDILRDADKVDIFRVLCDTPPEQIYNVTSEELKTAPVTQEVKQCFLDRTAMLKSKRRTPIDSIVGHICLAFELVYPVSRQIAREQGYVEKLLAFQSENEETARWFAYMREHIWEHA